jgi:hypothetical protein
VPFSSGRVCSCRPAMGKFLGFFNAVAIAPVLFLIYFARKKGSNHNFLLDLTHWIFENMLLIIGFP